MRAAAWLLIPLLALGGCNRADDNAGRPETAREFPRAERAVSGLGSNQFSTESERDSVGEAQKIMELAEIKPGMTVADIGAGEGYYTVRLAEKVGAHGRVLAEDIDREALYRLARRVERERLDNVSIRLGTPDDPRLPNSSFDRVFMVHMYHEVQEPFAFLWRLWPSLKADGRVVVVEVNRATNRHGIDPLLLSCELERVGFKLEAFKDAPELAGYYAQFKRAATRPKPAAIEPCRQQSGTTGSAPR